MGVPQRLITEHQNLGWDSKGSRPSLEYLRPMGMNSKILATREG